MQQESQLFCVCSVGVCVFFGGGWGSGGGYPHEYCWKGSYSTAENSKTLISAVDICIRRYEAQLQLQSLTWWKQWKWSSNTSHSTAVLREPSLVSDKETDESREWAIHRTKNCLFTLYSILFIYILFCSFSVSVTWTKSNFIPRRPQWRQKVFCKTKNNK